MITIGNCGYESRHQTIFEIFRPNGTPDYTFLFVKSKAFFEIEGKLVETPANTVMLYPPNTYVHYGCSGPYFNDDWIHFELGPEDLPFLLELDLPFGKPCPLTYAGQLPEYTRLIVSEKNSQSSRREQALDSLMHAMLISLSALLHIVPNEQMSNKYYGILSGLRMSILNAPYKKWTVGEMSKLVHMSPSYFQHLYKGLFGIPCMQECIQARLKNACFYLRTTDMSINTLAEFCGYDNELHFMRQFKKYTGMTPSQYRAGSRSTY